MPNRIQISSSGNAISFYKSLSRKKRCSLEAVLDYIRDFPYEHGEIIKKRFANPVILYVYRDNCWRVSYTMDKRPNQPLWNNINVFAIAFA